MAQILQENASTPNTLQACEHYVPKLCLPKALGPTSQGSDKSSLEDEAGIAWRSRSNALDVSKLSPRRAKRIVANRQAAHRSRMKKMKYTSSMEQMVAQLQEENRAVAERITGTQRYSAGPYLCGGWRQSAGEPETRLCKTTVCLVVLV